jgi:hypothetical protein
MPDLTAGLNAEGAGAWRPIETAPRDGTPFWAFQAGRQFVCWEDDHPDCGPCWFDDADSEPDPTHWMPLPAPPALNPQASGEGRE